MKSRAALSAILLLVAATFYACGPKEGEDVKVDSTVEQKEGTGQSGVVDNESQKNVVQIAVGSPDHTTLVTAIKTAEYVDVLSNAGPFTVFAPTNDAFNKLPAGTVDNLLKPENKATLADILEYHVFVGVLKLENMQDGQIFNMVNGGNVTIGVKDGAYTVNGANIVATVPASNGVIYIVDNVLQPPAKQ